MLSFSLDWNCVIALENDEPAGADVFALAEAHRAKRADVALLSTSASESLRDNTFPGDFKLFEDRVRAARLGDLPVLPTPWVWSLTFLGSSYLFKTDRYRLTTSALWALLFPGVEPEPWHRLGDRVFRERVHTPGMKAWRNAWCDVHNLVTHIDHGRDVFVTSNTKDFQRNSDRLRDLGVKSVLTPAEARALVTARHVGH